jgi:tRNA(Ile)-lysidine synthase TilS/MesJ
MKRCVRCILPETFPGIKFDSEGVCSICTAFDKNKKLVPSIGNLKRKFNKTIAESKKTAKYYHALVAYSGGKDSTYLIYTLKRDFGLKLLAVTLDNGFIAQHAFENMRKILDSLGVDHIIFKPGFDIARRIFSTSANEEIYPLSLLKFGSSVCISCIRMVTNMSLKIAIEKKIPMVMLGNSPGQLLKSENEIMYQDNRIPYELKGSLFKPLADRIGDDIYYYLTLSREDYNTKPFPYTISPFPIIGYEEKIIYETIEKLGWVRPADVDPCSTNCQLNSYGIVKHIDRLNYHPYDYEMAMLARLGTISREEALRRIEESTNFARKLSGSIEKRLTD